MQNFSDHHLPIIDGAIAVPTGGGTEAFVDAADIAVVAVETLLDPDAHAGAQYAPTGPRSLSLNELMGEPSPTTTSPRKHGSVVRSHWRVTLDNPPINVINNGMYR